MESYPHGCWNTLNIMPKSQKHKVSKFEVDFVTAALSDFSRMFTSHTKINKIFSYIHFSGPSYPLYYLPSQCQKIYQYF